MSSTYPSTAGEALQTKLLGNLGGAHGVLEGRQSVSSIEPQSHVTEIIPANLAC